MKTLAYISFVIFCLIISGFGSDFLLKYISKNLFQTLIFIFGFLCFFILWIENFFKDRSIELLQNQIISLQQKNNELLNEDNEAIIHLEKENSVLLSNLDYYKKLSNDYKKISNDLAIRLEDCQTKVALSESCNEDLKLQLEDLSSCYKKVTDENRDNEAIIYLEEENSKLRAKLLYYEPPKDVDFLKEVNYMEFPGMDPYHLYKKKCVNKPNNFLFEIHHGAPK